MKNLASATTLLIATVALSACQSTPMHSGQHAVSAQPTMKAQMHTTNSHHMHLGDMYLRPVQGGVQVYGKLTGLKPNSKVAVHIHENGSCFNSGKAAGGHFNPKNNPHGHPNNTQSHAGDMPNVTADANGVASYNYLNTKVAADKVSPNSVYQRAIVVHAGADDYTSQPSGDAGDRIACGVIEMR